MGRRRAPDVSGRGEPVPVLAAAARAAAFGARRDGEPLGGSWAPGAHPRGRGGRGVSSGLGIPPRLLAGPRSPRWLVRRMQGAGKALHELLLSAQRQGCLTAGVYESAKVLNV